MTMRAKSIRLPLSLLTAFDRLYARIPTIDCKGLCPDSCGMIPLTAFEWSRMVAAHGKVPGPRLVDAADGRNWCPFLTDEKQCEHYAIRPLICRLWGVVDHPLMRCTHGCKPDRYLTEDESRDLMAEADQLGFGPTPAQMEIVMPNVLPPKPSR